MMHTPRHTYLHQYHMDLKVAGSPNLQLQLKLPDTEASFTVDDHLQFCFHEYRFRIISKHPS